MEGKTAQLMARTRSDEVAPIPDGGRIVSITLSLLTLSVLSALITRRAQKVRRWPTLPLTAWLLFLIYLDSYIFVFVTAILKDIGINESGPICGSAAFLCLSCYNSSKILIYYFLVEKVYIIRGSRIPRLRDPLYLFNTVGMLLLGVVVVILNFVWRISYKNSDGMCIMGGQRKSMMPLIIFDVVINVYLTSLFLLPLRKLYSYRERTNKTLRKMALRTFLGSCATLTSCVTNLTFLTVLDGEPGWICLMCCNADILFSVIVLHWVTSFDSTGRQDSSLQNRSRGRIRRVIAKQQIRQRSLERRSAKMGRDGVDFDLCDEEDRLPSSPTPVDKAHLSWSNSHSAPNNPNGTNRQHDSYGGLDSAKATVQTHCEAVPMAMTNGDYRLDRIVVTKEQTREVEVEEVNPESRRTSAAGSGRSSSDKSQSPLKSPHREREVGMVSDV